MADFDDVFWDDYAAAHLDWAEASGYRFRTRRDPRLVAADAARDAAGVVGPAARDVARVFGGAAAFGGLALGAGLYHGLLPFSRRSESMPPRRRTRAEFEGLPEAERLLRDLDPEVDTLLRAGPAPDPVYLEADEALGPSVLHDRETTPATVDLYPGVVGPARRLYLSGRRDLLRMGLRDLGRRALPIAPPAGPSLDGSGYYARRPNPRIRRPNLGLPPRPAERRAEFDTRMLRRFALKHGGSRPIRYNVATFNDMLRPWLTTVRNYDVIQFNRGIGAFERLGNAGSLLMLDYSFSLVGSAEGLPTPGINKGSVVDICVIYDHEPNAVIPPPSDVFIPQPPYAIRPESNVLQRFRTLFRKTFVLTGTYSTTITSNVIVHYSGRQTMDLPLIWKGATSSLSDFQRGACYLFAFIWDDLVAAEANRVHFVGGITVAICDR